MNVSYNYSISGSEPEGLMVLGIIFLIAAVIGIAMTVVEMIFAKKCGAKLYGLVWLPIGREYVAGQIADKYNDRKARIWYPILSAVLYVGMIIWYVSIIVKTVGIVMQNPYGEPSESEIMSLTLSMLGGLGLLFIPLIAMMVYEFIIIYRTIHLKDSDNATLWFVLVLALTFITGVGPFVYFIFKCASMNKPNTSKYDVPAPAAPAASAAPAQAAAPVMIPTQVTENTEVSAETSTEASAETSAETSAEESSDASAE